MTILFAKFVSWTLRKVFALAATTVLAVLLLLAYEYAPSIIARTLNELKSSDQLKLDRESLLSQRSKEQARQRKLSQEIRALESKQSTGFWHWLKSKLIDTAIPELKELRKGYNQSLKELSKLDNRLLEVERELVQNQTGLASFAAACRAVWLRSWKWILWLLFLVLFGPFLGRVSKLLIAWVCLPMFQPIELLHDVQDRPLVAFKSARSMAVELDQHAPMVSRAAWVTQLDKSIGISSRFLWRWSSPALSCAAGLLNCSVLTADKDNSVQTTICLTSPHVDDYLTLVELSQGQSICIRPHVVIALSDSIKVKAFLRMFSLHAWLFGQLRYIVLIGPGKLVICGNGGLEAATVGSAGTQIAVNRVVGFQAHLRLRTNRSNNWRACIFGSLPIVEADFAGEGTFVAQLISAPQANSIVRRTFEGFWSAVGKVLGF